MSDLKKAFQLGLQGKNKGLPTGIPKLNRAIHGLQRGVIIGLAGSPKSGKSTVADSAFLINPYIYSLEHPEIDIEFFYWSLELSKIEVRFKAIAHFFSRDHGISTVTLPDGRKYKGSPIFPINPSYLLGKMEDDEEQPIIPTEEHQQIFEEIVETRINPMFGTYDEKGNKLSQGKVTIIEDLNDSNPTGIFNYLVNYAKENGTFLYEGYEIKDKDKIIKKKRLSGYTPNNPEKYVIVITDHLRALKIERGFTLKQNIDKMLEYQVLLRNNCKFTFIDILHLNRNISDIQRIKYNNEYLFPNDDDLKDTGNLSEVADFLLTIFDATDDRYNIHTHFGMDIDDIPFYRSLHLVRSRHTEAPVHIQLNAYFGISSFTEL